MPTPFSKLMSQVQEDGGALALRVPEDWMQGRSVFGGLQAALAVRAMRALVPTLPLRSLQVTFVAPVGPGVMRARATVLRTGKNAVQVEARLFDGDATLALVVGVFGASRTSTVAVTPQQPTVEVHDDGLELPYLPGLTPAFTQHFGVRWVRGAPPFTGDRQLEHVLDVSFKDEGRASEGHVVALADFIPPLALSHLEAPAPGSSVTWMLELLTDLVDPLGLSGWRVDAQLMAARDGYTHQSVVLWGPGGEPVALSRQTMVVFG